MEKKPKEFILNEKVRRENRVNWRLYNNGLYRSNNNSNFSGEIISKLMGVKNQGGFRYLGSLDNLKLVILYSNNDNEYGPNIINNKDGLLTYRGDNNTPGNNLHNTNLHGNEILRNIKNLINKHKTNDYKKIPPIFAFSKEKGRNVYFVGLVLPNVELGEEWLQIECHNTPNGEIIENYLANFKIINIPDGINLAWLNDIENDNTLSSVYIPLEWKKEIEDFR